MAARSASVKRGGLLVKISADTMLRAIEVADYWIAHSKRVHDLLQITKLYTVFEVFDEEPKAVASF